MRNRFSFPDGFKFVNLAGDKFEVLNTSRADVHTVHVLVNDVERNLPFNSVAFDNCTPE